MSQIQARLANTSEMSPMMDGMFTHLLRNLLYIVHTTYDSKWPVHQAVQYHWVLDGSPYKEYYIVVL